MTGAQRVRFDLALIRHIAENRNDAAEAMIRRDLISAFDGFGTLLHYAAAWGNATIARYLIRKGSVIDSLGKDGRTPLALSVEYQQAVTAKILLEAGACINIISASGKSVLQLVFHQKQENIEVEELVERLFVAGCTLDHAVMCKEADILKGLLQRGFDDDNSRNTALRTAARVNDLEMAKIMIENGADVNASDRHGIVPLGIAARKTAVAMVQFLLQAGADLCFRNSYPRNTRYNLINTPFLYLLDDATSTRDYDRGLLDACVAIFLEYGAMPKERHRMKQALWYSLKMFEFKGSRAVDHLIADLALLEAIEGLHRASIKLCEEVSAKPGEIVKMKNYYKLCQLTLEKNVYGTMSLFDLLAANAVNSYQLRQCARNGAFVIEVEKFCAEEKLRLSCPYYYMLLMRRISEATRTLKLEDQALLVICEYVQRNENECYVIARKIFSYLSEHDLKQLVKCLD